MCEGCVLLLGFCFCCCKICCPCEDNNSKNCKCTIKSFYLYFIYQLIIFLLMVIFIFTYKNYDEDINDIAYEIEKTLNIKLINSIKNKTICDLDEEELILGSWDGTSVGCYCKGVVYDYECSDKLVNQGCKIIPSHKKIDYKIINSNYLCVKRSKISYRYLLRSNQLVGKSDVCPTNYKFCGIIDTLERKLCLEMSDVCPINKEILNELDLNINNNFNYMDILEEKENLSDDSNQILSVFQLNQKLPCINPVEKYWDYHYILEKENQKCETKIYDTIFDNRYEQLSEYTTKKYELYLENGIMDKLVYIDDISLNKIKKDIVFLFGRSLLGLNRNILDNFDFDKLKAKEDLSNKCIIYMLYSLFGILGVWALIIAIVFIIECKVKEISIKDCGIKCDGLDDSKKCKYGTIFSIGAIASVLLFLAFFIFICIIFNSYKLIENMINIEGSDQYLSELIADTFEKYEINFIYPLAIIILFCLQIIILPISFCCCKNEDEEDPI